MNKKVQPTGYWTFFCSPAKWEIDRFLRDGREYDDYSISNWQSGWFKPGQLGIVRVGVDKRSKKQLSGNNALKPGIYSIVEVLDKARVRGNASDPYWIVSPPESDSLVVDIRYLKSFIQKPLLISDMIKLKSFNDKYLIKGFQASSMPLMESDFQQIIELLNFDTLIYENIEWTPADTSSEIRELENKYQDAVPEVKEVISKHIERGQVANAVKKLTGYKCLICEALGLNPTAFQKKNGEPYIEAHHVNPVSTRKAGTMSPSNIITVCANHHRQLHYGNVFEKHTETDLMFSIDGVTVKIKKLS